MLRRLAVPLALGLVVAVPAVRADDQTDPARLAVTASSDHCAKGLPVVDYTVANLWPSKVAVQVWWLADAEVPDVVGTHKLDPAPVGATGSFTLPFDFYTGVTVYATATRASSRRLADVARDVTTGKPLPPAIRGGRGPSPQQQPGRQDQPGPTAERSNQGQVLYAPAAGLVAAVSPA